MACNVFHFKNSFGHSAVLTNVDLDKLLYNVKLLSHDLTMLQIYLTIMLNLLDNCAEILNALELCFNHPRETYSAFCDKGKTKTWLK